MPMAHLGAYIQEFAELLGDENQPVFKGIKKASIGCLAEVPVERVHHCHARIVQAKNDKNSKPGRHLREIEALMGRDSIHEAQILDEAGKVIHVIFGARPNGNLAAEHLYQEGTVDGWVTGLVGADDSMHLYVRDHFDRDLKLVVRDEALARNILSHFRSGTVRLCVRGTWLRTENGWSPEANKCVVRSFDPLDDTPLGEVLAVAAKVQGNGWTDANEPQAEWANIRGIH